MEDRYFEDYGILKWIEPKDYYAEPWSYVGYAEDDNGEQWDLVRSCSGMEMRYTIV